VEEALRSSIPVVMIDIKGDFPNLLMMFPHLSGEDFAPRIDEGPARRAGSTPEQEADRATWGTFVRGSALRHHGARPILDMRLQ
jgi:hypothetical protein